MFIIFIKTIICIEIHLSFLVVIQESKLSSWYLQHIEFVFGAWGLASTILVLGKVDTQNPFCPQTPPCFQKLCPTSPSRNRLSWSKYVSVSSKQQKKKDQGNQYVSIDGPGKKFKNLFRAILTCWNFFQNYRWMILIGFQGCGILHITID